MIVSLDYRRLRPCAGELKGNSQATKRRLTLALSEGSFTGQGGLGRRTMISK